MEEQELTIAVVSKGLSPMLTGQLTSFKEALNWLQFAYTSDRTGECVAPVSMVLVQSVVVEGYGLFLAFYWKLWKLYTGGYALATDYSVVPTRRAPKRRESQRGEGGGGIGILTNSIFSDS